MPFIFLKSSAIITWSNIRWYWMHHRSDWDTVYITVRIHKIHPIPRPNGQDIGCFCEDLGENWPRYNRTRLYTLATKYSSHNIHPPVSTLSHNSLTSLRQCLMSILAEHSHGFCKLSMGQNLDPRYRNVTDDIVNNILWDGRSEFSIVVWREIKVTYSWPATLL